MNAGGVIAASFWTVVVGVIAWGLSFDLRRKLDDRRSARLVVAMCEDGRAHKFAVEPAPMFDWERLEADIEAFQADNLARDIEDIRNLDLYDAATWSA